MRAIPHAATTPVFPERRKPLSAWKENGSRSMRRGPRELRCGGPEGDEEPAMRGRSSPATSSNAKDGQRVGPGRGKRKNEPPNYMRMMGLHERSTRLWHCIGALKQFVSCRTSGANEARLSRSGTMLPRVAREQLRSEAPPPARAWVRKESRPSPRRGGIRRSRAPAGSAARRRAPSRRTSACGIRRRAAPRALRSGDGGRRLRGGGCGRAAARDRRG